ncbi:kyphoscoliosis peptidase-like [Gigantopelta aegis]|uniref:kyphoscoliosis peptidase-like n=1 Tax=Gigantopelta aegis TaxID=1735272 RepID=UPI001B88D882|nr:kyphoscoliosis peptidase-like [Gigantopelta aegis]
MGCGSSTRVETLQKTNGNQETFTSRVPPRENSSVLQTHLAPPRLKKKDIIPDLNMFAAIDRHALEAPTRVRASPEDLVAYLIQPARNDLEKVRAFYRWITNNISYDVEGFFSGNHKPGDPQSVLQSGTAVCQGYGDLFDNFCKLAHIPCHVVSGFAKGYSYNPEIPYTATSKTNHAWNIVLVKGEWRLVECTWGAGFLADKMFKKEFTEVYFLTDPELFVHAHFPFMNGDESASRAFQLMKRPISLNEYNRNVNLMKYGLEWDVEMLSHREQFVTVNKEVDIILQGRRQQLLDVMCHLNESVSKKDYNNFAMVKRTTDGKFSIHIRPPIPGKYDLMIFGKVNENERQYQSIVKYIIVSSGTSSSRQPYPEHKGAWGAKQVAVECGFNRNIFSHSVFTCNNGEFELSLVITDHTPVSCQLEFAEGSDSLDRYMQMTRPPHYVNIKARLNNVGFYAIKLFAGKPESTTHEYVGSFLIDNKKPTPNYHPFPYYWSSAHKHHCIILEPANGDLVVNESTLLRCIAPSMKRLMVDKKVFTNTNGDIFEIPMEPKSKGDFTIYGSIEDSGSLNALFKFQVV